MHRPVDAKPATALCNTRILKIPEATFPWFALARIVEECFWRFGRLMKKLLTFLSICTTIVIIALPVAAGNSIVQPDIVIQDPCSDEGKDALYQSFLKNRNADQAKAYEDAKKYLACPAPAQVTEAQQKIIDYLKKFVSKYEDLTKKTRFRA